MSAKANQLRIGIFVVAGVAILAVALFLFGIRGAFQPMYRFETYVTGDVEGLSRGSAVKLRGVAIGKVKDIGFSWRLYGDTGPRCVVVRFEVEQRVSPFPPGSDLEAEIRGVVEKGFRAVVQSEGITGSSIVALKNVDPKAYPPLAVPWKPRDLYIPSAPSQFGQILASLDRTLANLAALDLGKIGASADRALNSADVTIRKLCQLDLPALSRDVNRVTTDASAAVREYQGLASDARQTLQALKLERVGADADRLVNNLDSQLQVLITKLNAVDVPALNDTLSGTREAARNLNDALEALKAHPSGFLFGGAPAPVSGLSKGGK
jgi:ABC-type transporter Mla subunit MlaD